MKRGAYIVCFTFLGFLLQLLIHAMVEKWYITLLLRDFDTYGFGWSWHTWFNIHTALTIILAGLGLFAGYWLGKYCWPRLYDEFGQRRKAWPRKKP